MTGRLCTRGAVAFDVATVATKPQITGAIEGLFGVKVKAVTTSIMKDKAKRFRGHPGKRKDVKRGYVTLEERNAIDVTTGL